ncbi:hypothetical protein AC629_01460 [Bradyrhizobium sp. NAS80.1]|nr:hypothetical protein AC629_01460 [Bradyrhizobium sp. NAS80.1]
MLSFLQQCQSVQSAANAVISICVVQQDRTTSACKYLRGGGGEYLLGKAWMNTTELPPYRAVVEALAPALYDLPGKIVAIERARWRRRQPQE